MESQKESFRFRCLKVLKITFPVLLLLVAALSFLVYPFQTPSQSQQMPASIPNTAMSSYSFEEINKFRADYNTTLLTGSTKAYDLALFLAKERSNGRVYSTEKEKDYIFGQYGLANNSFILTATVNVETGDDIKTIIYKWKTWDKEILLDKKYSYGNVACYNASCALVMT